MCTECGEPVLLADLSTGGAAPRLNPRQLRQEPDHPSVTTASVVHFGRERVVHSQPRLDTVQARIDLVALEGGVACFGSGATSHAVGVHDVIGADAVLASADHTTQDWLLAGRAQFLNAQTAPFQVLVRAEPVDLDGHLRRVRARAEALSAPLAGVARDYVGFLKGLGHQRTDRRRPRHAIPTFLASNLLTEEQRRC